MRAQRLTEELPMPCEFLGTAYKPSYKLSTNCCKFVQTVEFQKRINSSLNSFFESNSLYEFTPVCKTVCRRFVGGLSPFRNCCKRCT